MKYFFLFSLALMSFCFAQTFTEITDGGWGQGREFVRPSFADIDNDGLWDVIIGNRDGTLQHFEQESVGSSTLICLSKDFNGIRIGDSSDPAPCIFDIDNDGLLDLLIGNYAGTLPHYKQTAAGSSQFSLVSDSFNGINVGRISTPSFVDLDNDGLLDLIVGEEDGNLNHYEQDAVNSLSFSLVTENFSNIHIGLISTPCFFDLDQDGLLELLVGENVGPLHYYKQHSVASTVFDSVTTNYCQLDVLQPCPVFVDFDHNGLEDLMIGDIYGNLRHFEQVNATSDSVKRVSQNVLPGIDFGSMSYPFLIDLDNDNLMDLIVGAGYFLKHLEQETIGSSHFSVVADTFNSISIRGGHACPVLADIDHNGLLDMVVGNSSGYLYHFEQSAPNAFVFNEVKDTFDGIDVGEFSTPCLVDLDKDGLYDMIIGNGDGLLFHYEQTAEDLLHFELVSENFSNIDIDYMARPCFTDFNNDGRLDLIIGDNTGNLNHFEQSENDPTDFTLITSTFAQIDVGEYSRPIFGDVNNDGLDDLIIGEDYGGLLYFQRDNDTKVQAFDDKKSSIEKFDLKPIYPNPFNSQTNICFALSKPAHVEICVFDLAGKMVEMLRNDFSTPGNYHVIWEASTYPSGVYIINMKIGSEKLSQKCLFLK